MLAPYAFVWANAKTEYFREIIEACEMEVSTDSQINEYMTSYDNPSSR